jgi:hypothetical protein
MKILPAFVLLLSAVSVHAAQPGDLFDFWIGDWSVTWKNANGSIGHARNHVVKTLDGRVIEENFEQDASDPPPLLRGHSLSVRQQRSGVWQQAWADNQGGFFALSASVDGDRRIFSTEMRQVGDKTLVQRMVFHDIKADSFVWDWESSSDGGAHWQLQWRLDYRR